MITITITLQPTSPITKRLLEALEASLIPQPAAQVGNTDSKPVEAGSIPAPAATTEAPAKRGRGRPRKVRDEVDVVEDTRHAAGDIQVAEAAPAKPAPLTLDDVRACLQQAIDVLGFDSCKALFDQMKVPGLKSLKPEQYATFVAMLNEARGVVS